MSDVLITFRITERAKRRLKLLGVERGETLSDNVRLALWERWRWCAPDLAEDLAGAAAAPHEGVAER